MRLLAVLAVGGALWGLWALLWREPCATVILAGSAFLCGLWMLQRAGRVTLALPKGFFRLDLWLGFFVLVGARVAVAVAQTAWAVLRRASRPGILAVPLRLRSETAQLLLLWAITVTPGTIALLAEGDVLYIHCLHLPSSPELPGLARLQDLLERIWG